VLALESGADDYLGRPFGPSALLARLRLQLRREPAAGDDRARRRLRLFFQRADSGRVRSASPHVRFDRRTATDEARGSGSGRAITVLSGAMQCPRD